MINFKKKTVILLMMPIVLLICVFYIGFNKNSSSYLSWNDIYNKYPIGSSIDSLLDQSPKEIKIIMTSEYIVILFDLYENNQTDAHAFHLCFYGKDLKLKYASYFPGFLDSIGSNGTIHASYGDSVRYKRGENYKILYRCDLPPNYNIQTCIFDFNKMKTQYNSDFLVEDIDLHDFPQIHFKMEPQNEYKVYSIEQLHFIFYGEDNTIYAYETKENQFIQSRLKIIDKMVMHKFYTDLKKKLYEIATNNQSY